MASATPGAEADDEHTKLGPIAADEVQGEIAHPVSGERMMRYRSRRDLVELVLDPAFADGHVFKLAAIERTISYPTQIMLSTSLRPPIYVLLILLLLASAVQNVVLSMRPMRRAPDQPNH